MSRLSRHDMKRDEVREGIVDAFGWIAIHGRQLLIGAGVLILLGVVGVLVLHTLSTRSKRASVALGEALETYGAAIEPEGAKPDDKEAPSFASEVDRDAAAKEPLEKVYDRYGSTAAGRVAGVYLGEIAARAGDNDRARELWERFLKSDDRSALAASVRLDLIALDRAEGRDAQVVERLRAELDKGSALPADVILWELGQSLENEGQTDEARATFQRLVDEHPTSPYASQAQQRLGSAA